ncbi:rare lipoprotein A [Catalinimonas alkaloidigena]|uniref:Probable endolytic peptidoglycan transglycosylase RlpA n=1 Tax=Catalinimonas alkaloidigena TaxID=1075417 RepID=A0A1G9HX67_9BACT|nr:septal ring lytic transglycosylase RlpA family protein [Catalinimonas alkaloidigena]SDL17607.1 rare lipoprotein A [Catalinimonas alkaloidigena]
MDSDCRTEPKLRWRPFHFVWMLVGLFSAMLLAGCQSETSAQEEGPEPYQQEGTASYYANMLQGNAMSNGEPYRKDSLTAAHMLLPLGTKVAVTNLENDSTVTVEITDRGPYHSQRILDLSKAAARQLDMIDDGTASIRLEVIEPAAGYTVADSVAEDRVDKLTSN